MAWLVARPVGHTHGNRDNNSVLGSSLRINAMSLKVKTQQNPFAVLSVFPAPISLLRFSMSEAIYFPLACRSVLTDNLGLMVKCTLTSVCRA